MTQLVYETLLKSDGNGGVIPWLAEEYSVSDDGMAYTFKIRDGVKFQNGDPLTVEDVVFSVNRAAASPYCVEAADAVNYAEAIDESTVVVHMDYPYMVQDQGFTTSYLAIVSQKVVEEQGDDFGINPGLVGTGPYIFDNWNKGSDLTVVRNEDYWGGKPYMEKVTFRFYSDATAGDIAVETGEIDVFLNPSTAEISMFEGNDDITVHTATSPYIESLAMNTTVEPFNDPLVRKAISMCFDKNDVIIAAADEVGGIPTGSFCGPSLFGNAYDELEPVAKNIEEAKALLAQAGYPNGFDCVLSTPDGHRAKAANVIQQGLKEIGINATVDLQETNSFYDGLSKGNFQMAVHGFTTLTSDSDCILYLLFETSGIGIYNYSRYSVEKVDQLLNDSRSNTDSASREQQLIEVQKIIYEDVPTVPLYLTVRINIANSALKGMEVEPNNLLDATKLSW